MREHKGLVASLAKSFYFPGGDFDDVFQEGCIGLYKAVRDYKPNEGASFDTFASIVVKRHLMTAVKGATTKKMEVLSKSYRFEQVLESDTGSKDTPLGDFVAVDNDTPLDILVAHEDSLRAYRHVNRFLSPLEKKILVLHMDNFSYNEICEALGCGFKSVDNALARIRRKVRLYLGEKEKTAG